MANPRGASPNLMDCREFRSKHVAYVDDLLAAVDMDAMRAHLGRCSSCAHQDTSVRRSLMLVRNLPVIEPSPDFMIRLSARLAEVERQPVYASARSSAFFSIPAMGTFAAVAAGIGIVVVLSFRTTHYVAPSQLASGPAQAASITNAPLPDFNSTPAVANPSGVGADVTPLANAAYVAAVPTGIPIWPAMLMAGEAPVRLVNLELQQGDGR